MGFLLWNLEYDTVLWDEDLPDDVNLAYYVDDTLMLVVGEDWRRFIQRIEDGAQRVVDRIRRIRFRGGSP